MPKRKKRPEVPPPTSGPLQVSWDDAGKRVYTVRNADGSTRPATEAELAALAQRQADYLAEGAAEADRLRATFGPDVFKLGPVPPAELERRQDEFGKAVHAEFQEAEDEIRAEKRAELQANAAAFAGMLQNAIQPAEVKVELSAAYEYRQAGAVYHVRFDGETANIPADLLGAKYIAKLLEKPNRPISATMLRGAIQASDSGATDRKEELEAANLYRKTVCELQSEKERAEKEGRYAEAVETGEEIAKIRAEIHRLVNKTGKGRGTRDLKNADRAAVSLAIERVRSHCREKWGLPRFAEHLGAIETGSECVYRPAPPVPDWNF